MKSKRLSTGKDRIDVKDEEDVAANQLGGKVKVPDLIWVKINGGSWWPAQVFEMLYLLVVVAFSNQAI